MYCCPNYHQKGNVCVECEPGFSGKNCSLACVKNYYGLLCEQECDCPPDKYCDNVRGCLCNTTSINCTEKVKTTLEVTSVSSFTPYESNTRSSKAYLIKVLIPSLMVAIAFLTMCAVLGRKRYTDVIKRNKDPIIGEQSVQEDQREQDNSNEEYDVNSTGIYNHLTLQIRSSYVSFYNTRRDLVAELDSSGFPERPHPTPCQKKKNMILVEGTDGRLERYVDMVCDKDNQDETTESRSVTNEALYSNAEERVQNNLFHSNMQVQNCRTLSRTDVSNSNDRHLSRSVADIRPDSLAVSEDSEDLYFNVSYGGLSTPNDDKRNVYTCYPLSSPTLEKKARHNTNLLKEQANFNTNSRTSRLDPISMSPADLISKSQLCFPSNTRPGSSASCEDSDEPYMNLKYLNHAANSLNHYGVSERPSSLCGSELDDDGIFYVNSSNLV
uniref:Uncharacterized protein LOC111108152 n=1 Tax=Crassostrea virginica TaxID=6565 RepID=A0A8B8B7T0_CRAVI|nr:uncharacterized protein LOC111108152 [Crassostrea virginica]